MSARPSRSLEARDTDAAPIVLWRRQDGDAGIGEPLNPGVPSRIRSRGLAEAMFGAFGDPCVDVLNAVAPALTEVVLARTSPLNSLIEKVASEVLVRDGEYVVARVFVPEAAVGASVTAGIVEFAASRISVSVLAYVWNTNQCGSRIPVAQVTLPRYGGTFFPRPGSTGGYSCHIETWYISFDAGAHESPIRVKVCEWAAS